MRELLFEYFAVGRLETIVNQPRDLLCRDSMCTHGFFVEGERVIGISHFGVCA